jgi:pyruvate/2-oxoglutarate dehydrogenase complex dihydrolipoamide acyltransferase (E2) component
MFKSGLVVLVGAFLAGCSTNGSSVIDFGPEPGSPGDESFWHFQPAIHGPGAPRDIRARPAAEPAVAEPAGAESSAAPAAPAAAATTTPVAPPAVAAPAPAALPALPSAPPESTPPAAPTSESMFNDAIRRAVAAGDVDRALKLLEEAERLGSRSARPTFIEAVKSGGQ